MGAQIASYLPAPLIGQNETSYIGVYYAAFLIYYVHIIEYYIPLKVPVNTLMSFF